MRDADGLAARAAREPGAHAALREYWAPARAAALVNADDLHGAVAVYVLVVASALPSAVPFFLIDDPQLALRVATPEVAMLVIIGVNWARSNGANGWRTGLVMMLAGVLLVGIAVVLGG